MKELNLKIIERFPELKEKYKEEVSWQEGDDTGSHIVYGDVFTPFFKECLIREDNEMVKKCLGFTNEILSEGNSYFIEVISQSVIESLYILLKNNEMIINYDAIYRVVERYKQ